MAPRYHAARSDTVMAATPTTTHATPIHAASVSFSPRKTMPNGDTDRHAQIGLRGHADRPERLHQPEVDHQRSAVEKNRQAISARIDARDGDKVHGWSIHQAHRAQNAAPR